MCIRDSYHDQRLDGAVHDLDGAAHDHDRAVDHHEQRHDRAAHDCRCEGRGPRRGLLHRRHRPCRRRVEGPGGLRGDYLDARLTGIDIAGTSDDVLYRAVSYTHLDVYKRQPPVSSASESTMLCPNTSTSGIASRSALSP